MILPPRTHESFAAENNDSNICSMMPDIGISRIEMIVFQKGIVKLPYIKFIRKKICLETYRITDQNYLKLIKVT